MRDEKRGYKILCLVLDKSYEYGPVRQYLGSGPIIKGRFRASRFVATCTGILTFIAENGPKLRNNSSPGSAPVSLQGALAPLNTGGDAKVKARNWPEPSGAPFGALSLREKRLREGARRTSPRALAKESRSMPPFLAMEFPRTF